MGFPGGGTSRGFIILLPASLSNKKEPFQDSIGAGEATDICEEDLNSG